MSFQQEAVPVEPQANGTTATTASHPPPAAPAPARWRRFRLPLEEDVPANELLDLFKKTSEVSLTVVALLYVAGWSYLSHYYERFGISIEDLNFPQAETLLFPFSFFFEHVAGRWVWIMLTVVVALFASVSLVFLRKIRRVGASLVLLSYGVFACVLWQQGITRGRQRAERDMRDDSVLPLVAIWIDPTDKKRGTDEGFERYEFKLLIHTNGHVYCFKPIAGDVSSASSVEVYRIPDQRIRRVKIQQQTGEEHGVFE